MVGDLLDEASIAGVVLDARDRVLDLLRQATAEAAAAGNSAAAAALSAAGILTAIQGVGIPHRWVGTALQVQLKDGNYGTLVDLQGPAGQMRPAPIFVTGTVAVGLTPSFTITPDPVVADRYIVDVTEVAGSAGSNGWTPVLGIVPDGQRRVEVVVDWTGGTGNKPETGVFLGPNGFTSDISAATDVRGVGGATGISGANFMAASTTPLPVGLGTVAAVLTPSTAEGFATCQYMALVSQADPRNAMAGLFQAYDPATGTLTIMVLQSSGSGTHADWIVTPSQVLTIPVFVDDGFYDGPQGSAASTTVSYVAVSPSASADDDGTY